LRAWQRLVRVIGHELNNSLAPIKSIAGSLTTMLKRTPRAADWEQDMLGGLEIIESRSEGLNKFMQSYARLAKLPAPHKQPCELGPLLRRIVNLENRESVQLTEGPAVTVALDAAQVEQVLINLIKNAIEAAPDSAPGRPTCCVRVGWRQLPGQVEIYVEDDGPGIANPQNLFVPSSRPSPPAPASDSSSAARSPKITAAPSRSKIARMRRGALRACGCRLDSPAKEPGALAPLAAPPSRTSP
jgi:two-component system nitrogen regulation sensor histidine kinase NtrY